VQISALHKALPNRGTSSANSMFYAYINIFIKNNILCYFTWAYRWHNTQSFRTNTVPKLNTPEKASQGIVAKNAFRRKTFCKIKAYSLLHVARPCILQHCVSHQNNSLRIIKVSCAQICVKVSPSVLQLKWINHRKRALQPLTVLIDQYQSFATLFAGDSQPLWARNFSSCDKKFQ
jgi:hypothetical protein